MMNDEELTNVIRLSCGEALAAMRDAGEVLYRGFSARPGEDLRTAFRMRCQENRKPKNTAPEAQEAFDRVAASLGFQALRRRSTFVSGDANHARRYGKLYVCFPLDGFSFIWSTSHKEIVIKAEDLAGAKWRPAPGEEPTCTHQEELLRAYALRQDGLVAAIRSGHEIGIYREYIAVEESRFAVIRDVVLAENVPGSPGHKIWRVLGDGERRAI
jgi:hypothetical protein